jgi:hypothetical protein
VDDSAVTGRTAAPTSQPRASRSGVPSTSSAPASWPTSEPSADPSPSRSRLTRLRHRQPLTAAFTASRAGANRCRPGCRSKRKSVEPSTAFALGPGAPRLSHRSQAHARRRDAGPDGPCDGEPGRRSIAG